ncbi:MAG: hypothetical protein NTAFB01_44320 [Nitrospira sp.]
MVPMLNAQQHSYKGNAQNESHYRRHMPTTLREAHIIECIESGQRRITSYFRLTNQYRKVIAH